MILALTTMALLSCPRRLDLPNMFSTILFLPSHYSGFKDVFLTLFFMGYRIATAFGGGLGGKVSADVGLRTNGCRHADIYVWEEKRKDA